jgi:hypothetical protein
MIAQKLRRATPENSQEPRQALLAFWDRDGHGHFRLEEEILLPSFAAVADPYHPLIARVLCDHVAIRQRVGVLALNPGPAHASLNALGRLLEAHVRLEERELFPLIESAMTATELEALARALNRAEGSHDE